MDPCVCVGSTVCADVNFQYVSWGTNTYVRHKNNPLESPERDLSESADGLRDSTAVGMYGNHFNGRRVVLTVMPIIMQISTSEAKVLASRNCGSLSICKTVTDAVKRELGFFPVREMQST